RNDRLELAIARQDLLKFRDDFADRLQFLENFVDRELRQAMQLEFEDGIDLDRSEADSAATRNNGGFALERADFVFAAVELHARDFLRLAVLSDGDVLLAEEREQVFARVGAAGRSTDDADHVVEIIERDLVADQNVFALTCLAQLVERTPAHDFDAVV